MNIRVLNNNWYNDGEGNNKFFMSEVQTDKCNKIEFDPFVESTQSFWSIKLK